MAKAQVKAAEKRIPLLEWASAAVGLLILAVIFVFLGMEMVKSNGSKPPVMLVEATGLAAYSDRYIVEVKVRNESPGTGAAVHIEGTINEGERSIETSSATVDYVPGMSQRRAGLVFTRDPRKYRLEMRVTGYERP